MDCKQLNTLIHELIDGTLGTDQSARCERHIAGCRQCAEHVRQLRSLDGLLGEMGRESAPLGFADRIVAKLKEAGRITAPAPVPVGAFHWTGRRFRLSLASVMLFLVAVVVAPMTVGSLEEIAGKGAVLVSDAYVAVAEAVANADLVFRMADEVGRNLSALKTIALAGVSLLARAGDLFLIPALLIILLLTIGGLFFFRIAHKRGAEHATFSF